MTYTTNKICRYHDSSITVSTGIYILCIYARGAEVVNSMEQFAMCCVSGSSQYETLPTRIFKIIGDLDISGKITVKIPAQHSGKMIITLSNVQNGTMCLLDIYH